MSRFDEFDEALCEIDLLVDEIRDTVQSLWAIERELLRQRTDICWRKVTR